MMDISRFSNISPFHEGEQKVQASLGLRDKMEPFARRVIRDHMPDQHRKFYGALPFLLIGAVDKSGRPWATIRAGHPGFITTPDAQTLVLAGSALPGDPLARDLQVGADIAILGIQPDTRRRNRMTGRVASHRADGLTVAVRQAFGNCPQYIHARAPTFLPDGDQLRRSSPIVRADRFDFWAIDLISRSDTLFVATVFADGQASPSRGADISHRGGKPGFVRVEDDQTFVFPDFAGNNYFNTVGNMVMNPKAGFLFVDFESGSLLYLTGTTEIVWGGEMLAAFSGAERLIRFRLEELVRAEESLPIRFTSADYSPMLTHTGSWEQADATVAANRERDTFAPYEIVDIAPESAEITSFALRRYGGEGLASYEPGQFLPIRLQMPRREQPVARTYTVSRAPGADHYRLSIKREGGNAVASSYFHDSIGVGDRVEAMAPRGKFVLDRSSARPVVLLSAGVGITPMIAMAESIIKEGLRTRHFRPTWFVHGARNGRAHAFSDQVREFAAASDSFAAHIRYSRPDDGDRLGETHDSEGHVDIALLKRLLPFDDYDFYLCGPSAFMQSLYDDLTGLGVREERIHTESFGPASVLKREAKAELPSGEAASASGPVAVRFAASGIEAVWSPEKGTLLDLAESAGLSPTYSCRSGICGTCATAITRGAVDYVEVPSAEREDDEVLICCATPRPGSVENERGQGSEVVLDL